MVSSYRGVNFISPVRMKMDNVEVEIVRHNLRHILYK